MRKSQDFYKKLARNGFYIILFLCITAIGISGYLLFSGGNEFEDYAESWDAGLDFPRESEYDFESALNQTPLIMPDDTEKTEDKKPAETAKPAQKTEPAKPKQTQDKKPEEDARQVSKETAPPDEPVLFVSSLSGRIDVPFSKDELIKSKTFGDWRTHSVTDIIAEEGAKVRAIADGVVKDVYEDEMMGHTVIIEHSKGYKSVYSNLMKGIVVKKGQSVKSGEVIGGVGSSSLAECMEEPHLHLEVWKDGVPVDPMSVIYG